jgi:hypothetical protein
MTEAEVNRIAALLHRISDRAEREEIVREVAKVLAEAGVGFDRAQFYHLASVEAPSTYL